MRRLFVLTWLSASSLFAGLQEEQFLQAHTLYRASEFQKALEIFELIEPKTSAVWYNIGNCIYHCGDEARAYICWMKAQRHAPGYLKKCIEKNLTTCLKKLGKEQKQSLLAGFVPSVYTMLAKIPRGVLQVLFLAIWYSILFLVFVQRKRIYKYCYISGVILMGAGLLVIMHYYETNLVEGIICKKEVPLYAGPDSRYDKIGQVNLLDTMRVYQQLESWCKVGDQSCVGWILAESIELL